MNRREFLGRSISFAGLTTCCPGLVFAAPHGKFIKGKPNLVFGVVSDIHVRALNSAEPLESRTYFTGPFRAALELFRDEGADAVVVAGDMANSGVVDELKAVADTWFGVFPDDLAPDGRKVERVFVYGNHDVSRIFGRRACKGDKDEMKRRAIALDRAKWWREVFREDFSEVYRKTVKGYDFIGAHWAGELKGRDESFCRELEGFYAKVGPSLDAKKPFFHVQHPHPKGTCHGETVWGQDDGASVRALSNYPNAVSFSGHSHNSLLDDRAIWQGAFTSVATATASHVGMSALRSGVVAGYENYKSSGANAQEREKNDHAKVMPIIDRGASKQAQIVRVYGDRIVFSRYDLADSKPLAKDLVMPLSQSGAKPFAFEPRRAAAKSPAFPAGAAVKISRCKAVRRGGAKGAPKTDAVEVSVPAANAEPSARGVRYMIEATGADGSKASFAILHDAHRFRAGDARSEAPMKCRIALDRLPKGETTFKVTAYSWWDKPSATLETKWTV